MGVSRELSAGAGTCQCVSARFLWYNHHQAALRAGFVGLSMMSYKEEKESKTCFGERQARGRIGKALY